VKQGKGEGQVGYSPKIFVLSLQGKTHGLTPLFGLVLDEFWPG